jgi:hypothetical protein
MNSLFLKEKSRGDSSVLVACERSPGLAGGLSRLTPDGAISISGTVGGTVGGKKEAAGGRSELKKAAAAAASSSENGAKAGEGFGLCCTEAEGVLRDLELRGLVDILGSEQMMRRGRRERQGLVGRVQYLRSCVAIPGSRGSRVDR